MIRSEGQRRSTLGAVLMRRPLLVAVFMSSCISVIAVGGHLEFVALATAVAAVGWFVSTYPSAGVMLYLSLVGGIHVLQLKTVGGAGFGRPEDVVLAGMLVAVVVRVVIGDGRRRLGSLGIPLLLLALWSFAEVSRNISPYGMSALGEFRFEYLPLVLPFFIVLFFADDDRLFRLLKWILVLAIVPILTIVPVLVIVLRGGSLYRMATASLTLGLLFGLVFLWAVRERIGVPRLLLVATVGLGAVVVVVGSNRSVWTAAVASVAVLYAIGASTRGIRQLAWLLPALSAVVAVAVLVALFLPSEATHVRDYGRSALELQGTAGGRIHQWLAYLPRVYEKPVAGEGFGPNWSVYVPESGQVLVFQPHNFYLQTLLKLGLVGLALYAWLMLRVLQCMRLGARELGASQAPLIGAGMAIVSGTLVYQLTYSSDVWALAFTGLGLAAALNASESAALSREAFKPSSELSA